LTDPVITAVLTLGASLLTGGGVLAWFKLGPERNQITVTAGTGGRDHSKQRLKDIQDAYERVSDELGQYKMQGLSLFEEHAKCTQKIAELELSQKFMQTRLGQAWKTG